MKRVASQLVVAVVCGFLGFLLTYQFKLLNTKDELTNSYENSDILQEVESLKKEKEELEEANATLNEEIKALEDKATSEGELEAEIKKKLDNARMQLGLVDVKGPGIIITLTPKTSIFGTNTSDSVRTITEDELVYLVNTLWYSRAEAISINDIRITPQTGIKNAGSSISIGSAGRVDPSSEIVIKVIGDKSKLNVGVSYGGFLGLLFDINIPDKFSPYMSVAVLACLDSVFGALKANLSNKFQPDIFISGFFGNALLAAALAYLGDKLGIPIYIAAVIVFGGRIFDNFAIIRRILLDKYKNKQRRE